MRALVLDQRVALREDHPLPAPAPGEALVRVLKAGICSTDLELVKGYMGFRGILGHELVGQVVALPAGPPPAGADPLPLGARVVAEINCVPPEAPARSAAERAQDKSRTTLGIDRRDGAFAEYVAVPLVNLHPVPDTIRDQEAVFVEPLAAACQILVQVAIKPTDRVYVLGDGKLGLLCAQVLAAASAADVLAIGRHDDKLALLRRRGIRTARADDPIDAASADVVVECTGTPGGFLRARALLRPRGTLVLKSTYAPPQPADGAAAHEALSAWQRALVQLVIDEITVVGSRCGPFAAALRLLAQKRVEVLPLISARHPLTAGVQALAAARAKGACKIVLDIAEPT
jgi:threonine dehydrogenase-like Zn-dependent dehydrogenase